MLIVGWGRLALPDGLPAGTLAEIEKAAIVQTLQRTNWNKQEAAQILGLYRPTLYSKMKKHDIKEQRAQQQEQRDKFDAELAKDAQFVVIMNSFVLLIDLCGY